MHSKWFLRLSLGAGFALLNQAAAQTLEVTSTGVGIGTTTPITKLHVYSTSASNDALLKSETSQSSGTNVGLWMTGGAANANWLIGTNRADIAGAADNLLFYKVTGASGTKMVIRNDGNVGIGTTAPTAPFQVNGSDSAARNLTAKFVNPSVQSGAGAEILIGPCTDSCMASISSAGYPYGTYASDLWLRPRLSSSALGTGLYLSTSDNVGIGTSSPGYKLEVSGSVRATSFIANSNTYADFVFAPDYPLASLSEVEAAIQAHGHLPDIPSAAEAKAHGVDLAEMQVKLLQKVEELTLYLLAHEKEIRQLRAENIALQRQVSDLEKP